MTARAFEQVPPPRASLLTHFRMFQIRALALILNAMSGRSAGRSLLVHLRDNRLTRALLEGLLGFTRTFPSFTAAQASASKYIPAGHEHPDEIHFHCSASDTIRESDYAVLFHLAPLVSELRRVFDLGGNVGNLFYSYQRKLKFSPELRWIVYDLPIKKPLGEKLAAERSEPRICFADSVAEASGCDVFIVSGALHYFEQPLHEILASLDRLPSHVFVNRTPFSNGQELITVQDNHSYLVPCKLHCRAALVNGMQDLGYELQSAWPVYERRLVVPLYPDICERTYSGFYFKRQ
jgi:putative methyltransferase (TIGR04325 family)